MPFDIGISGLNAANADLKVTGNNIANTATVGFKSSRAEFSNIFAVSKNGAAATAIGKGVRVSAISQQFLQGNISFSGNNLDLAINGDGFYNMVDQAGNTSYSRNGEFKISKEGFVVNNDGLKLQGYQVNSDKDDTINTGNTGDLQLTTQQISPNATTTSELIANIDAASVIIDPATIPINPEDPDTYHHTTSYTSYDSLGNEMLTTMYFQKNSEADAIAGTNAGWTVGTRVVDSQGVPFPPNTAGPPDVQNTDDTLLEFDTTGSLVLPAAPAQDIVFSFPDAGGTPGAPTGGDLQVITVDISKITQYGASFGVTDIKQNGYSTGDLSGIEFDQSGVVRARFTNGKSLNLGQVILSNFTNEQGLGQQGNNQWVETFSSGQPVVNAPGQGGSGLIQSGALEESNVNLTEELINLITAQRNFQANAKTISTADTIAQTVINL